MVGYRFSVLSMDGTRLLLMRYGGLLMMLGLVGCAQPEPAGPPNIVLVFADDLGYGDLSSYGHPLIHTPRLDSLAQSGVRLTSFYVASPSCTPSRAALLTGRYPVRSGMNSVLMPESQGGMPDEEITMAEALRAQGYRTAHVGKWHLGHTEGHYPEDHGFDQYYGILYSNDMMPPWVQTELPLELYRGRTPIEHPIDQATLTERYTDEAVAFIEAEDDRPFFLYLAYSMPHVPVFASERFQGTSAGDKYGDVIETIDWSVGQLTDALARQGVTDNTLVIFTSDNGPWTPMPPRMLSDPTRIEPWDAGSQGPFRGAKATTYEGGHRVPFIAAWPGQIAAGQTRPEVATAMDIYTTVLECAGATVPADHVVDGVDLWPLLTGQPFERTAPFFYLNNGWAEAVRDGAWKLRWMPDATGTVAPELFHLARDPYERFNVADAHPERVAQLHATLQAFADETGARLR